MPSSPVTTEKLVNALTKKFGEEVTANEVKIVARKMGLSYRTACARLNAYKAGRGKWNLSVQELEQAYEAPAATHTVSMVPATDKTYVPFGNFNDLHKVIKSKVFYPTFITGLSGNGKTLSVEQACAKAGRELIRVNITIETDEDDLLGGFRLVNGDTVWHNGPVIEALERGAVLLLDEIDLASNKILCLQSILEGKGVFLKKVGRWVTPAEGFTVVATANTKGKGSDDGRFVGTNVLNEAFLERFPLTFEQEYPTTAVEVRILNKICKDQDFTQRLADWSDIIRRTFYAGGIDEVISTRRLVHIVQAYKIFNDRLEAIQLCLNRFDDETKQAFLDLYSKVDDKVDVAEEGEE